MAHDKRWRLVCYDVRDPKRYRRAYRIVRGSGRSVQYSIFRCRLDDRETERLRWELARALAPEDSLLVIDLCPSCARHVVSRNHVDGWDQEEPTFLILPALADDHAPPAGDGILRSGDAKRPRRKAKSRV
jgi:CRISPR-associated protein Cas2